MPPQCPTSSCPESSVDLRGATLDWACDLSSKKNVIHVSRVALQAGDVGMPKVHSPGDMGLSVTVWASQGSL